jgi:hypothetical protein
MHPAEEISLVLLLLIVIGSVALTLSLSFLHPKYRELRPRLLLSTKMLGVPILAYGLLRTLTDAETGHKLGVWAAGAGLLPADDRPDREGVVRPAPWRV